MFACVRRSGDIKTRNNRRRSSVESSVKDQSKQSESFEPQIIYDEKELNEKMTGSQIFEKYNTAVFMIYTSDGMRQFQGSGFFINNKGIAVSNYHVFEDTNIGMENIYLSDGSNYKIKKVIDTSKEYDYIVFEVDLSFPCNFIPISNKKLSVGEKIFTIGSPLGLENTFSSGEISQLRGNYLIQISAPIDHGSSGGALINEYGEVIGITSSGYDNSGANLNFAIDIEVVKDNL